MSIAGKHLYRFKYLKSEEWSTVRTEALAREQGKCEICGEESVSNDAHHIWYPKKIYETKATHLAILCRHCHTFLHTLMPESKTNDEKVGIEQWRTLKNAIGEWRLSKQHLFTGSALDCSKPVRAAELRSAYEKLKGKVREQEETIRALHAHEILNAHQDFNRQLEEVIASIRTWASVFQKCNEDKLVVDKGQYEI